MKQPPLNVSALKDISSGEQNDFLCPDPTIVGETIFECRFYETVHLYDWMRFGEEGSNSFTLPNVEMNGTRMRINNCPYCGKEIGSIELKLEKGDV